ncbi:MAG: ABC transporter permease [Planctomycetota bacterium]
MSFADRPLVQLFLVRVREFRREPGVLFWVFGFPLLLAIALGLAFRNRGPDVQEIAVVEGAGADLAAAAIDHSGALKARILPEADAMRQLQSGSVLIVLCTGTEPTLVFDPSRPSTELARIAATDALERAQGRPDQLHVALRRVTAPGERYIDFLLPGLLGMNLMSGGVWGVGWALVLMRTRKLLKRLAATPMRRADLLLSFMLFRVVLALVEVVFLMIFGALAFQIRVRGSYLDLGVLVALSALTFGSLGLLIASRAQNTQTANGLMNLATLPMFVLSGVFFSASHFPGWMQPLVRALPLTAINDGLRAVVLRGTPLAALPIEVGVLVGWGALTFVLALKWFRWT